MLRCGEKMKAEELWKKFLAEKNPEKAEYEAWAFGGAPDRLAELVLEGIKTGTSWAYVLYELGRESMPETGDYSVILDSRNEAKCIILTTGIYVVPFDKVSDTHAFREGEGDKSLDTWRRIHKKFFSDCLAEVGMEFDEKMKVVCEEFEVVFR